VLEAAILGFRLAIRWMASLMLMSTSLTLSERYLFIHAKTSLCLIGGRMQIRLCPVLIGDLIRLLGTSQMFHQGKGYSRTRVRRGKPYHSNGLHSPPWRNYLTHNSATLPLMLCECTLVEFPEYLHIVLTTIAHYSDVETTSHPRLPPREGYSDLKCRNLYRTPRPNALLQL
jgi:hypothetical protein